MGDALLERRRILEAAQAFALNAGALALRHYGGRVAHEAKGDGSPVTVADPEVERYLRGRIAEAFPDHGVLGEETGESAGDGRVRWIVDPIDATVAFMHGVPFFGVLIGVEVEGDPVVGVAHFPALQESVSAARGLGCTWNGERCRVSRTARIEDALVLLTDPKRIEDHPVAEGWHRLRRRARWVRTWGDCYGHALVATGRAEAMIDPVVRPWDAAPFLVIAEESGGRFTTIEGERTIQGPTAISTNGILHEEVLAELRR